MILWKNAFVLTENEIHTSWMNIINSQNVKEPLHELSFPITNERYTSYLPELTNKSIVLMQMDSLTASETLIATLRLTYIIGFCLLFTKVLIKVCKVMSYIPLLLNQI